MMALPTVGVWGEPRIAVLGSVVGIVPAAVAVLLPAEMTA